MRLTQFSEYALRLLIFAAAHPDRLVTVDEAATFYDISRAHLMKVANLLVRQDFMKGVRGRSGGLALARQAGNISLGALIRATEPAFAVMECFGEAEGRSPMSLDRWREVQSEAMAAFLAQLDRYSLSDLAADPRSFGLSRQARVEMGR